MLSPAQIRALKDLINLDRKWFEGKMPGNDYVPLDHRGLEIGWSVNTKTAKSLEDVGLAHSLQMENGRSYLFLGPSYENPFEQFK